MIRKSTLLTEQFGKLVIKNKSGSNIYDIIESFFLQKHNEKVFMWRPKSRGSVDYPSTRGILVNVE